MDDRNTGNRANGKTGEKAAPAAAPKPRRLVLLTEGETREVEQVLAEYQGDRVQTSNVHEEVQRFAGEHPGRWVAAEWLGPLGWVRFLRCRQ